MFFVQNGFRHKRLLIFQKNGFGACRENALRFRVVSQGFNGFLCQARFTFRVGSQGPTHLGIRLAVPKTLLGLGLGPGIPTAPIRDTLGCPEHAFTFRVVSQGFIGPSKGIGGEAKARGQAHKRERPVVRILVLRYVGGVVVTFDISAKSLHVLNTSHWLSEAGEFLCRSSRGRGRPRPPAARRLSNSEFLIPNSYFLIPNLYFIYIIIPNSK
jgi:hypothetical protein